MIGDGTFVGCNANLIAGFSYTAFHYVFDTKLPTYFFNSDGLSLERECGMTGNNE